MPCSVCCAGHRSFCVIFSGSLRFSVNQTLRGITYVSVWVVLWGTVASLMDWMLLTGEVYETGTSGQALTFIAYGAASVVMATRFAPRFLGEANDSSDAADQ